jgi:hypothetical protein
MAENNKKQPSRDGGSAWLFWCADAESGVGFNAFRLFTKEAECRIISMYFDIVIW